MTKVFYNINELTSELRGKEPLIATLGFFDGVHRGHQLLIRTLLERAREIGAKALIITLDQHPANVLGKKSPAPMLLTSTEQRLEILATSGADYLLVLPFSKEIANLRVEEFLAPFIQVGLEAMVLGYDNRFGSRESGETVQSFDARVTALGIDMMRVSRLSQEEELTVSSSNIRTALTAGDMLTAEVLLGRPYTVSGSVVGGRRIGRTIGYPTANVSLSDPQLILPKVGIYVAEVELAGKLFPAMAYYGSSPTITADTERRLEVFLLDYSGDLYGEKLDVALRLFLREDKVFNSLEELQHQLTIDERETRHFFAQRGLSLKNATEIWKR